MFSVSKSCTAVHAVQGEVKEDVYVAQVRLQEEVEELFAAIDKAKGQANGFIPKACMALLCTSLGIAGGGGGVTPSNWKEHNESKLWA